MSPLRRRDALRRVDLSHVRLRARPSTPRRSRVRGRAHPRSSLSPRPLERSRRALADSRDKRRTRRARGRSRDRCAGDVVSRRRRARRRLARTRRGIQTHSRLVRPLDDEASAFDDKNPRERYRAVDRRRATTRDVPASRNRIRINQKSKSIHGRSQNATPRALLSSCLASPSSCRTP